jgi:hypothetical protein
MYTSIAIGTDGFPVISYYDNINGDLKVAHCDSIGCSSPTITTVDADGFSGDTGLYTSIAIGSDGFPVISYHDQDTLWVAHCFNIACTASEQTLVTVGLYSSITIGSDGLPVISYRTDPAALKVAHCNNLPCSSKTLITLETKLDTGRYNSITIGADGFPVISYVDLVGGALKVVHCSDNTCTTSTITTVGNVGDVGPADQYTSITIGVDGLPVISSYNAAYNTLNVTHCSNVLCTPYWRRR